MGVFGSFFLSAVGLRLDVEKNCIYIYAMYM